MGLVLLAVLSVLIVSGLPKSNYRRILSYGPQGVLGLVLIVVAALLAAGFLTRSF